MPSHYHRDCTRYIMRMCFSRRLCVQRIRNKRLYGMVLTIWKQHNNNGKTHTRAPTDRHTHTQRMRMKCWAICGRAARVHCHSCVGRVIRAARGRIANVWRPPVNCLFKPNTLIHCDTCVCVGTFLLNSYHFSTPSQT